MAPGGRYNLEGWEMVKIMAILGTLVGKAPVEVVSRQTTPQWPCDLRDLYDMKVGCILVCQLAVLGLVGILLGHHHSLL